MSRPQIIIISAPSGAGKNSFVDRITKDFPELCDTVTFTTREMRAGESEGNPYHFVSEAEFQQKVSEGFFVEWARVHENHYGTPHYQLEEAWSQNRVVIMDIDIQGARTFKAKFPSSASLFIMPPSLEELKRRILGRDGALPADFEVRMENARREIACADEFDYVVTNDDFEPSYARFKKVIADLLKAQ